MSFLFTEANHAPARLNGANIPVKTVQTCCKRAYAEAVDSQVARWRTVKYQKNKSNHSPKGYSPPTITPRAPFLQWPQGPQQEQAAMNRLSTFNNKGSAHTRLRHHTNNATSQTSELLPPRDLICSRRTKGNTSHSARRWCHPSSAARKPATRNRGPSQQKLPGLPAVAKSLSVLPCSPFKAPTLPTTSGRSSAVKKLWPSRRNVHYCLRADALVQLLGPASFCRSGRPTTHASDRWPLPGWCFCDPLWISWAS